MRGRWYEQSPNLNEIIDFIQSLDNDDRISVVQHLLQILINECNIDLDEEFSKFSGNDYSYDRWYDENFELSDSLELLKNLPESKQNFVIKRFVSEVVMSFAKRKI